LPGRQDFDVLDLRYILGNLNLLEVLRDPMRLRYRVHGSNCASLLGYDMTAKLVDDYPDPTYRERVRSNMVKVVESRTPRCDVGTREIVDGRVIRFEALILPLAADGTTVDMLMTALSLR
jgi:hypothetical protein